MYFGIKAVRATQAQYDALAQGNIVRGVQRDGEVRLNLGGGMESLLLIEDEITISPVGDFLGAKNSLGGYYLKV